MRSTLERVGQSV